MAMSDDRWRVSFPPFPAEYRACGLLLHVTSLPSAYGIGDLGPSAFHWIDRLSAAGQGWWQSLPLVPIGPYYSPYQGLSSFAGNGLVVSPDFLIDDGLLRLGDCEGHSLPKNAVEYEGVITFKRRLLETAWSNFNSGRRTDLRTEYAQFCHEQAEWLDDYALFRALKLRQGGSDYLDWPEDLVRREPSSIARARRDQAEVFDRVRFAQFLLFRQGRRLKDYAHAKGVRLIGDMPFFVSPDSSDVWVNPELFLLDKKMRPRFVGGVPPDYFSETGQLWGNPVYDWEAHRRTNYHWWIKRLSARLAFVDLIRLDHFRGFDAAWHVPAGAPTAQYGEWVQGPGAEFFDAVRKELGVLPFIAEDLGVITDDVCALRDRFHLPGTRVLQFAFDGHSDNPHLPQNYTSNTVVYTGTHDNDTTRGWFEELPDAQRKEVWNHLKRTDGESADIARELIRLAWSSVAALAMVPLQDLLGLGKEARMNVPGLAEGNWRWRITEEMLTDDAFLWLEELTNSSNRAAILSGTQAGEITGAGS
jgi:4-alpha-glucanotransferase